MVSPLREAEGLLLRVWEGRSFSKLQALAKDKICGFGERVRMVRF